LGIGYEDGFKDWKLSNEQAFALSGVLIYQDVYEEAKEDLEKAKSEVPLIPKDCKDKDLTDPSTLESVIVNVVKKIINQSETHFIEYLSYLAAFQDNQNAETLTL